MVKRVFFSLLFSMLSPLSFSEDDFFFQRSVPLPPCPVCRKSFYLKDTQLLAEDDERRLFHVCCPSCNQSSFIFFELTEQGTNSFVLLTDTNDQDAKRLFFDNPISLDDVLETHNFFSQETWKLSFFQKNISPSFSKKICQKQDVSLKKSGNKKRRR